MGADKKSSRRRLKLQQDELARSDPQNHTLRTYIFRLPKPRSQWSKFLMHFREPGSSLYFIFISYILIYFFFFHFFLYTHFFFFFFLIKIFLFAPLEL
jgi:hypothetical protein